MGVGTVSIELVALGETQISRKLLRFSARAGNPRPAFLAISDYLDDVEKKQFDTEGSASGNPWPALISGTSKRKESAGLRPEILRASNALFEALTSKENKNKKVRMTKSMFIQGVKPALKYGEVHMEPDHGSHKQRKPVDLTARNRVAAVKILQSWIILGVPGRIPSA